MKAFGLFGFSLTGRSNLMCVVRATSDEEAATKLGGMLVKPDMSRDQMVVYGMRLPVLGEGWNQFSFGNSTITVLAAIDRLTELTKQPESGKINSIGILASNCDHLVLARIPFLED